MNKTLFVRYTGNNLGKICTDKWIGSVFEVYPYDIDSDEGGSYQVVRIIENAKGFEVDPLVLPSFYRFNAVIVEVAEIPDELFEI